MTYLHIYYKDYTCDNILNSILYTERYVQGYEERKFNKLNYWKTEIMLIRLFRINLLTSYLGT